MIGLNELLKQRMAEAGVKNQTAMTVMAPHRDPYRMEQHRPAAEWFTERMARIPYRPVHARGLHYSSLGTEKPDGSPYTNTDANETWMNTASKAARWLGLMPWTDFHDKKNDAPTVTRFETPDPKPAILLGEVEISFPDDLAPEASLHDFRGIQPFKLVVLSEKAAVEHVLTPIAERYGIDVYVMGGEISDTHIHGMAEVGAEDGRPMRVLTLSDADPAGYWMPATIAYKLQAFKDGWFPDLDFEVHTVALSPTQVNEINRNGSPLPGSPLKDGEKRAGAWEKAFGIEQVELDAIATLRPDVLRDMIRASVKPFYDSGLDDRVRATRREWEQAAQAVLEDQLGPDVLREMRVDAEAKLDGLQQQVDDLNEALWIDAGRFVLPDQPEIPAANVNGSPSPLAGSGMGFAELVERLKARAAYSKGGGR